MIKKRILRKKVTISNREYEVGDEIKKPVIDQCKSVDPNGKDVSIFSRDQAIQLLRKNNLGHFENLLLKLRAGDGIIVQINPNVHTFSVLKATTTTNFHLTIRAFPGI
jgi:hypothetical protein